MEKDFDTVLLLDTYAGLLTEKQLRLCDMYYNQDFSLAEIANIEKTTRQAVRDGISKAKQKLLHFENSLELVGKREQTLRTVENAIITDLEDMKNAMTKIANIWENTDGI